LFLLVCFSRKRTRATFSSSSIDFVSMQSARLLFSHESSITQKEFVFCVFFTDEKNVEHLRNFSQLQRLQKIQTLFFRFRNATICLERWWSFAM